MSDYDVSLACVDPMYFCYLWPTFPKLNSANQIVAIHNYFYIARRQHIFM